jgi:hypothetical protein
MDYVERCQSFLQWGQSDNDFLVYLPIRDLWAERRGDLLMMFEISNMDKNAPDFIDAVLQIDKLGYDCDYISDKYLLTTTYQDGMLQTEAGTRYKGLILPHVKRMSDELRAHIERLKALGAPIIDGIDVAVMQRLAKAESMKRDLKLNAVRMSNELGYHYFIANLSPEDRCQFVPLAVDFQSAMLFDPLTGKRFMAEVNERHEVKIDLRSGESIILETFNQPVPDLGVYRTRPQYHEAIDLTSGNWTLSFMESEPIVNQTFSLQKLTSWEQLPTLQTLMGTGVYTRHFSLTEEEASQQWMIDLGDVRESARVYINGKMIGCAWAVPFVLDCQDALQPGDNEIRIEVTNLPANRIAEMDRQHVPWRKFNNINVVDINYEHTTYDQWEPVPSGLNSSVLLIRYHTTE